MKKAMKKLSGMTLVEIIVALAVFAVMSVVLVTIGSTVEKHSKNARDLNSRVAVEGPIAEAQNGKESYLVDDKYEIKVGLGVKELDDEGNEHIVMSTKDLVSIEGTLCYVNPELGTNATATDEAGNTYVVPDPTVDEDDFTFKYIAVTMPQSTTQSAK
ncbi:MAG: type II secretion system protein [Ruminococcus sp.]|nr:type II secretion system protein [Ruminococcus sp.]